MELPKLANICVVITLPSMFVLVLAIALKVGCFNKS